MCEKKGVIRACTLMSMQACECPCAYEHVTACGRASYTCIREHVCVCTCVCTWHSPPPWETASPSPPWSWLWDARWAHDVFRPQGALSRAGPGSAARGPDEGLALQRGGHKGSLLPPCPRRPLGWTHAEEGAGGTSVHSVRWATGSWSPEWGPAPPASTLGAGAVADAREALGPVDLAVTLCVFCARAGSSVGRLPLLLLPTCSAAPSRGV